ncbi:MAG: AbrB family transcriptional regulator [Acidimicrobiia bacterium]
MDLTRTLLAAVVVGFVFDRLGVPAGALIGAMLGVAAVNLVGATTVGPGRPLLFVAFVILGWELGSQVTRSTLEQVRGAAVPIGFVVIGLLVAAGLLAVVLHRAGLDPVTAFLASSPGGISQMAALSTELGGNAVVVSVVHLIRVLAVVLTAPIVARLLAS